MQTAFSPEEIKDIRDRFPILHQKVYGNELIYFDNAATSQKPLEVITAIEEYYDTINSNVHRGVHDLSQKATDAYEAARKKIQKFIDAEYAHEIIFTSGATEGINLLADVFRKEIIQKNDTIIISAMEHHANIVPWQILCEETGALLKIIPINEQGELILDGFEAQLHDKVKLIAITHVSNTLGTINPVAQIIQAAHDKNIPVLLDMAQSVQHMPVSVRDLDVDFAVFSGHKMYGPTGTGIFYGKEKWLNRLPPYKGGGDMIKTVTFKKTIYNELPYKYEAGTPNIAGAIALGAAVDFIQETGIERIQKTENQLLKYATEQMKTIPDLRFFGEARHKAASISFLLGKAHPFDTGEMLDKYGIAVRTGHHCTEPLMDFFKIPGTVRASLAFYNTNAEIDIFVEALRKINSLLN